MGDFFADHVAPAGGDRRFLAVGRPITDDADTCARSNVFLFVFRARVFYHDANYCGRYFHLGLLLSIGNGFVKYLTRVQDDDGARASVYARTFNLHTRVFRRLQAASALQVSKGILRVYNNYRLSAELCSFVGRKKWIYAPHVCHYHVPNEA